MNKTRFGLVTLVSVLALGLLPVSSQEAPEFEEATGPGFEEQIAEVPDVSPDSFAFRMRAGGHGGPGGPGGPMGMGSGCPFLDGENSLSDEQYEKFYQIKNRMKDELGAKMLEMSKLRRQFGDELNRESIDAKAVSKLEDRMAALKAETSRLFTGSAVEMMSALTPEQRKAIRKKMIRGSGMGGCSMGARRGMMRHHGRRGSVGGHCPSEMPAPPPGAPDLK